MFDIGLQEMLIIGVLALLVFGPSKLPELGRMFGRAMREFRRASDEFRSTVETNLHISEPDALPTSISAPPLTESASALPSEHEASLAGEGEAVSGGPATIARAADESTEPFCALRNGRIFHRRECAWAGRIPEIDRVYMKRVADAVDQGFARCPVCEPWEPG